MIYGIDGHFSSKLSKFFDGLHCTSWQRHSSSFAKPDKLWLWSTVCYKKACHVMGTTWWRHQMETFSALLVICAGNSPVPGEFPAPRPVTRSYDVFFDLRLDKRFNKQSWGWWFETPSRLLRRHRNDQCGLLYIGTTAIWKPAMQ